MDATRRCLSFLPLLALLALVPASGARAQDELSDDAPGEEEEVDDLPDWTQEEIDRARSAEDVQDSARQIGTWDDAQRAANEGTPTWNAPDAPPPPRRPEGPAAPAAPGDPIEQAVPDSDADRGDVTFEDFREGLSSDGIWTETPEYGWVWVPNRQREVSDWRPYLYGRWVWTRHGWTWASEEPFGWATYHYGRWSFSGRFGWYWVPGYTWGPAWVAWRYGDAAVGWAPLYPGYVAWGASYPYYDRHWVFVGPGFFYDRPIYRHCFEPRRTVYYYRNTSWSRPWRTHGHRTVYVGPRRTYVTHHHGRPVRTASIVRVHERGPSRVTERSGRPVMEVYRPSSRPARRGGPAGSGLHRSFADRDGPGVRPRSFSEAGKLAPREDARAPRSPSVSPRREDRRTEAAPQPRADRRSDPAVRPPRETDSRREPGAQPPRARPPQGRAPADPRVQPPRAQPAPRAQPGPRVSPPRQDAVKPPQRKEERRSPPRRSEPSVRPAPRKAPPPAPRGSTFTPPRQPFARSPSIAPDRTPVATAPRGRLDAQRSSRPPTGYSAPRSSPRPSYSAPRSSPRPSYSAPRSSPRPSYAAPRSTPRQSSSAPRISPPRTSAPSRGSFQAPRPSSRGSFSAPRSSGGGGSVRAAAPRSGGGVRGGGPRVQR